MAEVENSGKWITPSSLPALVIGLLVICGTIMTVFAGLPVTTQKELAAHDRLYDARIEALNQQQRANADQLSVIATSVTAIGTAVAQLQQMQIDRDKEDSRLQQYQMRRQEYYYKRQDQHHRHEVDALTGLLKAPARGE